MRLWLGKVFATYSFVLVVRAASATTVLPPECTVYRTHTVSLSPSSVTTSYYETAPTYIDGTLAFQSTITETTYHTVPTTTTRTIVTTAYRTTVVKDGPTKTKDCTSTVTKSCSQWTRPTCPTLKTSILTTTYQVPALSTYTSTVDHEPEPVQETPLSTIVTTAITTNGATQEITTTVYATSVTSTYIFGYPVYESRRTTTTFEATTTSTRTTTVTPSPTATVTITLFSLQQEGASAKLNSDTAGLEDVVPYESRLTLQIARPWRTWKFYINSTNHHLYELSTGERASVDNDEPFGAAVFLQPDARPAGHDLKAKLAQDGSCGQRLRFWNEKGKEFWLIREFRESNEGEGYYYSTDPVSEGKPYLIAVGPTNHNTG